MELVEGIPLQEYVGSSHDRIRAVLRELATGMNALHRAGKLHRDVKPSIS
jgi:serine/threonine protein kinase